MAGEQTNEQESSQEDMANGYFDSYEIEEGAEESIDESAGGDDDDEPSQQKAPKLPPKNASKAGDGLGEKEGEFKKPEGLLGDWFKSSEDGSIEFDRDSALKFLSPEKEYEGFYYPKREYAEEKKEEEDDGRPEYEVYHENEQKRQGQVRENMTMWPTLYNKAIEKGYTQDESAEYANRTINEILDKEAKESSYKRTAEVEKRMLENNESRFGDTQLKETARTNENYFISRFGGGETGMRKYNEVLSLVAPQINKIFDLANPGLLDKCTERKAKDEINKFYTKIASDKNTLKMFVEMGMDKATSKILPHIVERGVYQGQGNAKKRYSPNHGIDRQGIGSSKPDELSRYMDGDKINDI